MRLLPALLAGFLLGAVLGYDSGWGNGRSCLLDEQRAAERRRQR